MQSSRRAAVVAAALAVPAAALGLLRWTGRAETPVPVASPVATTTVEKGDISTVRTMPGTLGHGAVRVIRGARTGVITWLPAAGATITRGKRVYAVNDQPVPLFYGRTPLYRDLATPGTVGRDVRVVRDNLRALGYSVGAQPSVVTEPVPAGSAVPGQTVKRTVHDGEAALTATLLKAIRTWQADLQIPAGPLTAGSVLVLPAAVRVSALSAQVGDPAAAELMSATSTSKVITVQADESEAAAIDNGDRATVALSDGSTTPARVTSVSTALQTPDGGSTPKLAITLALDQPAVLKRVDSADLQVSFAAQTHKQVLIVATGALLALREGGYALQTPDGTLIAVRTGIFAGGRVEVSGAGVTAGLTVVTTG
ncbi:efflux RND transporter periplasmic adaptor subunit [Paractinoplanes toevensis]|uniref:Peptidoglycan-binding protein n=1 Tax=Paractinoplanes toevensis TaxID=571911 RepID=A0A919W849_9ACTN|nr:efflux RND transporter periplasmic adaptor subunit [Actinoplanes toevensis]GIM92001.1 peptidoglycan-binding protein [Actinoplanes toevensis]